MFCVSPLNRYFQHLVEEFEERMVTYRQQIETLDNHLAALHQPSPHSPAGKEYFLIFLSAFLGMILYASLNQG